MTHPKTEIINVEDINSIGIAAEARKAGISTVTKLGDNGKSGDDRVTVYRFGDVRVADTNGDPVWEESDHAAFAELLASEGISLSTAGLGECRRVVGRQVVRCEIKPHYTTSEPQIYVPQIGTLARTGLCMHCDAAIYQREGVNGRYPQNLEGAYYHAVEGGLAALS